MTNKSIKVHNKIIWITALAIGYKDKDIFKQTTNIS